jgi:hypothetical protein
MIGKYSRSSRKQSFSTAYWKAIFRAKKNSSSTQKLRSPWRAPTAPHNLTQNAAQKRQIARRARRRERERKSERERERGKRQSERARNLATLASSERGKRPGISLGPFLRVDVLTREPLVLSQRKALNRSTHWQHPQLWSTTMLGRYPL